jgi:hypothetical protein
MEAIPKLTTRMLVKYDPRTGKILKAWSPDPIEVTPPDWLDGEIRVTLRDSPWDSPKDLDDTQCETWFDIG